MPVCHKFTGHCQMKPYLNLGFFFIYISGQLVCGATCLRAPVTMGLNRFGWNSWLEHFSYCGFLVYPEISIICTAYGWIFIVRFYFLEFRRIMTWNVMKYEGTIRWKKIVGCMQVWLCAKFCEIIAIVEVKWCLQIVKNWYQWTYLFWPWRS